MATKMHGIKLVDILHKMVITKIHANKNVDLLYKMAIKHYMQLKKLTFYTKLQLDNCVQLNNFDILHKKVMRKLHATKKKWHFTQNVKLNKK